VEVNFHPDKSVRDDRWMWNAPTEMFLTKRLIVRLGVQD